MATKKGIVSLPSSGGEAGLNRYLAEIKKFPILSPEEEYMLAKRWREHGDTEAAAKLVNSHLRLVAKIAMGYRGYGLPVSELISEGNIGLMQGVKKFEPDRGFRVATYAMWWIRASIQEFILRSWSLVKMGTTAAQKKLFFNLRRMKNQIDAFEEGDLKPADVAKIATDLGVTEEEVISMNRRMGMGGDTSLNAPLKGDEGGEGQWQDFLVDNGPLQDELIAEDEESQVRHDLLVTALESLNEREKHILMERRLADEPKTLEELSQVYGVSRERIRQIEVRAFEKLQSALLRLAGERRLLPARLNSARTLRAALTTPLAFVSKTVRRCSFRRARPSAFLRLARLQRHEGRVAWRGESKGTRVIALVGPAGAGKTSLAEAMLFAAGATDRLGSTANGSSIGDSSPEARQRGGSTELNLYNFQYLGDAFAILDCPGSVGFAADGARALAIADVAIVVVDPDPARAPLAAPALRALDELGIPHLIFVNRIDQAHGRVRDLLVGAPADERVAADRPPDSDLGRRESQRLRRSRRSSGRSNTGRARNPSGSKSRPSFRSARSRRAPTCSSSSPTMTTSCSSNC